jgi:hypothetical protein
MDDLKEYLYILVIIKKNSMKIQLGAWGNERNFENSKRNLENCGRFDFFPHIMNFQQRGIIITTRQI